MGRESRESRGSRGRRIAAALAGLAALGSFPAPAQEGPIGPCSPYRAADGDIPSEMPGCARHRRPAPGTLADELEFRRARRGGDEAVPADDEDGPAPRRAARHRRRD